MDHFPYKELILNLEPRSRDAQWWFRDSGRDSPEKKLGWSFFLFFGWCIFVAFSPVSQNSWESKLRSVNPKLCRQSMFVFFLSSVFWFQACLCAILLQRQPSGDLDDESTGASDDARSWRVQFFHLLFPSAACLKHLNGCKRLKGHLLYGFVTPKGPRRDKGKRQCKTGNAKGNADRNVGLLQQNCAFCGWAFCWPRLCRHQFVQDFFGLLKLITLIFESNGLEGSMAMINLWERGGAQTGK